VTLPSGHDCHRALSLSEVTDETEIGTAEDAHCQAHPGELVVVSGHGGIIEASPVRFLGLPSDGGLVRLFPDNASITEWAFTGARWWLVRFNDAAHLDPRRPAEPDGLKIPAPSLVPREQAGPWARA